MANIQIPNLPAVAGLSGAELLEGVQAGSSVRISLNQIAAFYTSTNISGSLQLATVDDFTGNGSTTNFTLSVAPISTPLTSVYIDGVYQNKDTFSLSGTTLIFSEAPPFGAKIEVLINTNAYSSTLSAAQVNYNEGSAGAVDRSVRSRLQDSVSVKDFGAVGNGVADDTAAIQAALDASLSVYIPSGTYKVSAQLDLQTGSTLFGDGSASEITCANGNISIINGVSTDNCTVRNIKVNVTVAGTAAYTGAVHFETSENCRVENVEIEGVSWAGVYLEASSYCKVTGIYCHDFRGTVQDSADVCVYRASRYNVIDGNQFFGNGWHGVLIQEPVAGQTPFKNVLSNNRIGAHKTYGVAVYAITVGGIDAFTQIVGNIIEDIDGATLSGNAGAGIYIQGCGGTSIVGNSIRNCCLSTSSLTLAPGGISISNLQAGLTPCSVSGNTITNIRNYYGVVVASSLGGVSITGNAIELDTNAASTSVGVYINASSNCLVTSNSISLPNALAGTGIFVFANGVDTENTIVSNNTVLGGTFAGVRFDRTAAFVNRRVSVSGNMVSGGSTANICYRFTAVVGGTVSNNVGVSDTANACTASNATELRLTGNNFTTSGTRSFVTSGTCTGSYYDKTNYSGNAVTFIQNAATGLIVEVLNNASPGASNWAVGDRVEQSVPVVGQPTGWRCTVAGVPGTWVSEGNL